MIEPLSWRDKNFSRSDATSEQVWREQVLYADQNGWLTTPQWRRAQDEIDEFGRVFSADEAADMEMAL